MRIHLPLILLIASILSGCSYNYELRAIERDGRILFEPAKGHGNGCLSSLSVKTLNGVVMWEVYSGTYRNGDGPCQSSFPVTYGVPTVGLPQLQQARPLKPGVVYKVIGSDGDSYHGAFKFREGIVVQNVELPPNSFETD